MFSKRKGCITHWQTVTVAMKRITYSVTWKVILSHIPDMLFKKKNLQENMA
jgi:hypothetical protein